MNGCTFLEDSLPIRPVGNIAHTTWKGNLLGRQLFKIIFKFTDKVTCRQLIATDNNFKHFLKLGSDHFWRRGFNCLNAHDLEFRFSILHTLTVMHIKYIAFLGSPNATVSNHFTFHHHPVLVAIHVHKEFLICFFKHWLKVFTADLVEEGNFFIHTVVRFPNHCVDKRTKVNVE